MYDMVNTGITCPNCGQGYMIREESKKVIKSDTVDTYAYLCQFCGFVHTARSDEDMKEWIERLDAPVEHKVMNNKRCSLNCEYFDAEDNGVYRCKKYFVRTALGRECRDSDPCFQPLNEEVYFPEDVVNHPSHYETGKFECFDVMREVFGDEAVQIFCKCNAFKYLYRHTRKNGVEDIRKAKWYIDRYVQIEDEKEAEDGAENR